MLRKHGAPQPSSGVGKPAVKGDRTPMPGTGAENSGFSGKSADQSRPEGRLSGQILTKIPQI
jgi:hypothetical protein